jgi:rubrerythrin
LAQNLSGHERNYKALLTMLDKVDSIITRIHCVEKDVEKTLTEMQQLIRGSKDEANQDHPALQHVSYLMRTRMEFVERRYGHEIQETMEPSRQVLGEKRKMHETQEFLMALADFFVMRCQQDAE